MKEVVEVRRGIEVLSVNIISSNRKSVALEIKADLTVNLRVPSGYSRMAAIGFLESRREWLFDTYNEAKKKQAEAGTKVKKIACTDGALLLYKGKECLRLKLIKGMSKERASISFDEENLCISVATLNTSEDFIRQCIEKIYRELAESIINKRAEYFAEIMGSSYNRITIKDQRTKWGSCSSKTNLNFNWRIVLMPEEILDYVVVHELSHLKEMNHSARFWSEVGRVIPDYKQKVEWLKKNGGIFMNY